MMGGYWYRDDGKQSYEAERILNVEDLLAMEPLTFQVVKRQIDATGREWSTGVHETTTFNEGVILMDLLRQCVAKGWHTIRLTIEPINPE